MRTREEIAKLIDTTIYEVPLVQIPNLLQIQIILLLDIRDLLTKETE
jgi:hypothetical protein